MSDLEILLRSTFAAHEGEAPLPPDLASVARSRAAHARRRGRLATAGTSVVVAVAVVAGGLTLFGESANDRQATTPQLPPVATPANWQTVSSLGVEISVPPTWTINGNECGQPPTVFREQLSSLDIGCLGNPQASDVAITDYVSPEKARPGEALVGPDATPRDVGVSDVRVHGLAATFGEGRMADGRTFLTLGLPSIDVSVTTVGPEAALLRQIIGSVRPVTVDSAGCTTAAPPEAPWDRARSGPKLYLTGVTAIDVCFYAGPRLGASIRLTGADAGAAVHALNAAKPGVARGPHGCFPEAPGGTAHIWLHVHQANGRTVELSVAYLNSGACGPWYVASPTGISQLTKAVLQATVWRLDVIGNLYPGMPGYAD